MCSTLHYGSVAIYCLFMYNIYNLHTYCTCRVAQLTFISHIDGAILRDKQHLLKETEQDNGQYPELESDEILVGTGHHDEPGKGKDGVDTGHHSIELHTGNIYMYMYMETINLDKYMYLYKHDLI